MNISFSLKKQHKLKIPNSIIIIFIIITIGTLYQKVMVNKEDKLYKPPGKLIEVFDHKMHVYSEGSGSPTVIFTVGSGTPSAYTDYYFIQKEISKIARTVAYDRLGYGWSEATTVPRTIDQQVNELHELLSKAGEKPLYVLVGHSLSSLEVIRYAQMFPKEVAGILLIDGGNPTYYADFNEGSSIVISYILEGLRKCGFMRILGNAGIMTPMLAENKRSKLLPDTLSKIDKALFYKTLSNKTNRGALKNINENARTVIDSGTLGDTPLIILTAEQDKVNRAISKWSESQQELKRWSSNSKQEEIEGASHYIHWDKSEIVIERIRELISSVDKEN